MTIFKTGVVISGDDSGAVRAIQSVTGALGGMDAGARTSSAAVSALGGSLGQVTAVLGGLLGGFSVGAIFGGIISNTISAEQELAQLRAVLTSTGEAAGFSAEQLQDMADSLAKASTFSSGEIISAQTRLLTYTNVVGEQFPQALQIAIDQAARLGISVEQSAEIVGRALQNPAKAMQSLGRQGFELKDSQKQLLQQMADTGRTAEAQAIVMDLVEESYGGAAKAARETLGGSLSGLKNNFNNLLEGKGGGVTAATAAINEFSDALGSTETQEAFSVAIEATFSTLTAFGKGLSAAVDFVVEYQDEIAAAGVATLTFYATLRAASALSALPALVFGAVAALQAMTGAATGGAVAVKALGLALRSISWPIALISAAAGALYYLSTGASEAESRARELADGLDDLRASIAGLSAEAAQEKLFEIRDQIAEAAAAVAASDKKMADNARDFGANQGAFVSWATGMSELKEESEILNKTLADLFKTETQLEARQNALAGSARSAAAAIATLTDEQIRAQASNEEQIKLLQRTRELILQGVSADEAATRAKLEQQGVDAARINVLIALERQNKAYTASQSAATKALEEHNRELEKYLKYVAEQLERDTSAVAAAVARSDEIADLQETLVLMQSGVGLEDARYQIQLNRLSAQEAELRASAELQVNEADRIRLLEAADKAAHERATLQLNQQIGGIDATQQATRRAAEQAAADWERVADDINRALTDSLFRAFEDGASFGEAFIEGLKNTAKTTVLRFAIESVTGPVTDGISQLLGGGGTGLGASLGSDLASTFFDGAVLPLADVLGNAGFEELAVSLTNFGANLAPLLSKAIPAAAAAYGVFEFAKSVRPQSSNVGSNAYGAMALNTFTAPLVALDAIGGGNVFGTKYKVDDVRLSGDFSNSGFEGDLTQYRSKKKSLGRGTRRRRDDLDETEFEQAFTEAFGEAFSFAAAAAEGLGLSISDFVYSIDESIKGLNGEDLAAKMQEILTGATDALANQLLPEIAAFALENETLIQTLGRVSTQTAAVEGSLETLGVAGLVFSQQLDQSAAAAQAFARIDLAQQLIDAAGGFEQFATNVTAYLDAFFTEAERFAMQQQNLQSQVGGVTADGVVPDTREGYRLLVEGLDVTSEAGREAYTVLTSLAGVADEYYDTLEKTEKDRQGLLTDVNDRIRELTIPAEQLARIKLDESFADLYTEFARLDLDAALIGPLYDLELAALNAAYGVGQVVGQFAEERAAFDADIAQRSARQGLSGQGLDLYDLQREFEDTLSEATRIGADISAVEAFYGAQRADIVTRYASAAAAELAQIQEAAAAAALAAEEARTSERLGLERQLLELQGNTAALRALDRAALDASNTALYDQIEALRDAAAASEAVAALEEARTSERLGLERQLLELQGNTAALRALDRSELDASNRGLFDQINALRDQQTAAAAAADAARELSQALASAGDAITAEVNRLRGLIGGGSAASAAQLQAQFGIATSMARSGDLDALSQLPEISRALEEAVTASAVTAFDINSARSYLASSLGQTLSTLGMADPIGASIAQPIFASPAPQVTVPQAAANDTASIVRAIDALRTDQRAQAKAITTLQAELNTIAKRWDVDGLPEERVIA